jgi:hypothetical protein
VKGIAMQFVFHLTHQQDDLRKKNRLKIGTYSTVEGAQNAIMQLQSLPGFRDSTGSFSIYKCIINHEYIPYGLDDQATIATKSESRSISRDKHEIFSVYNEPINLNVHPGVTSIMIGYYSDEKLAQSAIERIKTLTIFNNRERDFNYCTVTLDQTGWTNGYTTIEEAMKQYQ